MAHDPSDTEDDDIPQLPSDTLALLQQFQTEKDSRAKQFEDLKASAESDFAAKDGKLSMDLFSEDWQTSQFWYTDATARTLALALLEGADQESAIAVVSAPSVYIALRNILGERGEGPARPTVKLLEYDRRFEVFGSDFVYYDFQQPLRLPAELKGKFDRIICDPPFLSEDCQTKTALSVRYLSRAWSQPTSPDGNVGGGMKFISCTGERMADVIGKLYAKVGSKTTDFAPEHSKGLSNEFWCYANFEWEQWKWR